MISSSLLWALTLYMSRAHCFATSQYEEFFPCWSDMLVYIRDTNCTAQFNAFQNPDKYPGNYSDLWLPDCLMNNMDAMRLVEMSIVSILFGLLPSILTMIGPSPAEISLLALRRPVLAFLLAIPMPAVRLAYNGLFQDHELFQQMPIEVENPIRTGFFASPPIWFKASLSACEYTLAAGAVANMAIQVYQLAFWAVTVSAIAIGSGSIPKTYAPFLWILLIGLVHVITFTAMKLRYKEVQGQQRHPKFLLRWVQNEITPCVYGDPIFFEPKKSSYAYQFVHYWAGMGIVILFTYATIFLSSTIFISLGDAVTIMARFFFASIVCRWVLSFELHGMKEVRSREDRNASSTNDMLMNDVTTGKPQSFQSKGLD